jgi:PPOX class probable F420-dependent enzyme
MVVVALALSVALDGALAAETQQAGRPPMAMSDQETAAFLSLPLIARLATVRANGTPQLTPMWFLYDDGVVYMTTRSHAAKVNHIRKNPNVAVVVDVMDEPYKNRIVTIEGTAVVEPDPEKKMTTRLRRKYMGEGEPPKGFPPSERVVIKITPRKMTAVNTGKMGK